MSATDKRIIASIVAAIMLPLVAFASPTSVDRLTNHIEPLIKTDYMKAAFFTASSTSASTFPYASSTVLSANRFCLTADTCISTWPTGSGSSFGYPFPDNATTTGLGLYASTTIGDGTQTGGLTISGGSTTTGNALFTNASPSVTLFENDQTLPAGYYAIKAQTDALSFYRGVLGVSANEKFRIRNGNVYAAGIDVRSTSGGSFDSGATVSSFPVSGSSYINNSGAFGVGTTTPWAKLSIHANNGGTKMLFAVGSSTPTATTTLFSIDNTGIASTTFLYGANLSTCTSGNFLTWSGGLFGCAAAPSGSGSPAGATGLLQFNDGGSFGGAATLFWNKTLGFLGIGTTTPHHQLDVIGRFDTIPTFNCRVALLTQTNVTADQLGSATVAPFTCDSKMYLDVNGGGALLAMSAANELIASGTPQMQIMDASTAAPTNASLVFMKGPYSGSATSTNGLGIAIQGTYQTPNVGTATTSVNYIPAGFSDTVITSLTTPASYYQPTNGCLVAASSTPNWQLVCFKAGVSTMADTGFATSTTAFKLLLTLDGTNGAQVFFNNSTTANATISASSIPVTYLRPIVGVGLTTGSAVSQARMRVANISVWNADLR